MGSVYDIAHFFVTNSTTSYYPFDTAVEEFKKVLDMGLLEVDIYNVIKNKKFDVSGQSVVSCFRKPQHKLNLISPHTFYYHNMLRCMSKPAIQEWDMNAGTIVDIVEPYFLEMRADFTMWDLVKYYNDQFNIDPDKTSFNRMKGSFEFLLNKFGIDLVLFMIDTAKDIITSEDMMKPATPVAIAEYEHQARERLDYKISETKVAGDDKIVIRERVFNNRDGVQDAQQPIQEEYFNYS